MHLEVLGSQVALSRQEHLNVLGGGVENRGKLRGGHDGRLILQRTAKLKISIVWRLPMVMGEKRVDARRRELSHFGVGMGDEFRLRRCER